MLKYKSDYKLEEWEEVKLSDQEIINNFNIIKKSLLTFLVDSFDIYEGQKLAFIFNYYKSNKDILTDKISITNIDEIKNIIKEYLFFLDNNGDFINLYINNKNKGGKNA